MKIAVLNPNSSEAVTRTMDASLEPMRAQTSHEISCYTLAGAPLGIETDEDVAMVAPMVVAFCQNIPADAYVIACFSDPGLDATRDALRKPTFGIAESAYCSALVLGRSFGVISLGQSSIARHAAMIEAKGLTARLAGDRSIDMGVAEANNACHAQNKIEEIARELIDKDKAEVLILGCAGMGEQRANLQAAYDCIVIDPVQAGVADAIRSLDLNYKKGA